MSMGLLKRSALVTVAMTVLLGAIGPGQAAARLPWWHVDTISAPAGSPGAEDTIVVDVSNLGDALVEGKENPVTIVDELPTGVVPSAVEPIASEGEYWTDHGKQAAEHMVCPEPVGRTVTCTYNGPLLGYEHLLIGIKVEVAPSGEHGINEVEISGGDNISTGVPTRVAPVVSRRALELSESALPFGIEHYEMTPEEEGGALATQAGSHPFQVTWTFNLNSHEVLVHKEGHQNELFSELQPIGPFTKDLRFNLPPGFIGNPTPLPKCPMNVFVEEKLPGKPACPLDTVVGVLSATTTGGNGVLVATMFTEPVFALEPSLGEPARFGFQTIAGPVVIDTAVRTGGDYGVVAIVPDITQAAEFASSQLTLWGVPTDPRHDTTRGGGPKPTPPDVLCLVHLKRVSLFSPEVEESCPVNENGQPFLIMPTSCAGPLRTTVEADSWEQPGEFTAPKEYTLQNSVGEPIAQDGCNHLDFEPSILVAPDSEEGSTPTGLTVDVHVPQGASLNSLGLSQANVKDTTVALPAGVTVNPAGAGGLLACGLGEIALTSPAEQTCPEASKVGTVEIKTPLLPNQLVGAVYLAAQNANPFGSLLALYIVARDPVSGVLIKLAGQVSLDEQTGQLVSTFKDTPQVPFEDLKLHFFSGSRAPLGTPALCGSYTTNASFAPWSGNAPVDSSSEFLIASGPNHRPCSNPLPFAPALTTGSLNLQAGAFTPFTLTMSREDGNQDLKAIRLKMPPGLLGTLSNVELCQEAQANAGTCGPESLIGHTIVSVGLGANPFTVTGGEVFITGPYRGAPYGLSVVNPAKAGPFDLGKVVVRGRIEVDPITAELTITTDASGPYAIPRILDGIPLQIKHVHVTVDRPGFTFNPTNCGPMAITGSLTSSQGATSALSVPFQVTNCATLRFKPKFTVSTSGKTSRVRGASLDVKLSYPKLPFGSQANIAKVKVNLPKRLPSRLTTLQKACPDSVFTSNPAACPPASRVGSATARTPIIPVPLSGPAYFVSHGGAKFPELVIVLSGYGTTVQLHGDTFISKAGITSSTFRAIPDVPVSTFELKLPQGANSALAANGNLCKSRLRMPTAFVAQNGIAIHQSTPIVVRGCPKHKTKRSAHGRRTTLRASGRNR